MLELFPKDINTKPMITILNMLKTIYIQLNIYSELTRQGIRSMRFRDFTYF